MSQHSSLKVSSVGAKHRNVLKRYERIKKLHGTEETPNEVRSAFKLPKLKSLKIKVKKTKADKAAVAGEAGAATPAAAAPAAQAAKPVAKGK